MEERRLVRRVLCQWKGIAERGHLPRRDEVDPWLQGGDGGNCLLIAMESPVELSHIVMVGVNLAVALCSTDTLAGVLLSKAPQVASARRGLMVEGGATLRGVGILYRSALLPISGDGTTIDHVLGATNYRPLPDGEPRPGLSIFRTQWI